MTDLVGAAVLVKDDDLEATTGNVRASSQTPSVNLLCCIGFNSLWLQGLALLPVALEYVELFAFAPSMRLIRITPLLSSVLSIAGLRLVSRANRVSGGCECFSCSGPWLPWFLSAVSGASMLLTVVKSVSEVVLHEDDDEEADDLYVSLVLHSLSALSSCTALTFSFRWSWRAAQQRFADLQSRTGSDDKKEGQQLQAESRSAEALFAELDSRESKKFEAAYVIAEVVFFFVPLLFNAELTNEALRLLRVHSVILLMCFFFRTYSLVFADPGARISLLATAFDAFEFSWNGFAIAAIGKTVYGSFFMNILLSYMLLFVFPFRRALLVVPLCYLSYGCSAVFVSDSAIDTLQLFPLLGLGLCLNLFGKRVMQDSKWQSFLLIQEKTQLAIQEKVLRFQAEFSKEVVAGSFVHQAIDEQTSYMDDAQSHQPPTLQGNSVRAALASGDAFNRDTHLKMMPYPSSVSSAPALLTPGLEHLPEMEIPNCLPLDALAWVEGEARPRPLAELQPGSKILCYDRLGGSLKHATLLDVQKKFGPVEWTTVTLADGATLEMTSDHPMQPMVLDQSGDAGQMSTEAFLSRPGLPVRAADLKPGEHSLVFMQVVPSTVQSVTSLFESKARVGLTIQQPERHAIFVASPGSHKNGTFQTMAVESVNVSASSCVQLGSHQSFLTVSHPCEQKVGNAKASSAPPSLRGPRPVQSYIASEESDSLHNSSSSFSSADVGKIHFGTLPVMTSYVASCASNTSDNGHDTTGETPHYRLTDLLQVKAAGLKSRGSVYHVNGQCKPCAHENKSHFYSSGPCFKGAFCERCHEAHPNVKEEKRMEQRRRRRLQQAALKRQPPSSQGDTSLDYAEGGAESEYASTVTGI